MFPSVDNATEGNNTEGNNKLWMGMIPKQVK